VLFTIDRPVQILRDNADVWGSWILVYAKLMEMGIFALILNHVVVELLIQKSRYVWPTLWKVFSPSLVALIEFWLTYKKFCPRQVAVELEILSIIRFLSLCSLLICPNPILLCVWRISRAIFHFHIDRSSKYQFLK
jgi:hypothetical protein